MAAWNYNYNYNYCLSLFSFTMTILLIYSNSFAFYVNMTAIVYTMIAEDLLILFLNGVKSHTHFPCY